MTNQRYPMSDQELIDKAVLWVQWHAQNNPNDERLLIAIRRDPDYPDTAIEIFQALRSKHLNALSRGIFWIDIGRQGWHSVVIRRSDAKVLFACDVVLDESEGRP